MRLCAGVSGLMGAAMMMVAASAASAQGPRALAEWMLPGSGSATAIGTTPAGGLVVAGHNASGPRLVHLDGKGRLLEDWILPGTDAWPRALATPPGAVVLLAGPAEPVGHERGLAVWRLQAGDDGKLKQDWLRRFRRTALDAGQAALALEDGGSLLAGRTGGDGAWVLRLDVDGDAVWRRLVSPPTEGGLFEARAAALAPNGELLVAAYGAANPTEPGGIWVLRFGQDGADRAQTVIDELDDEHPEALAAFADGGLAVAGWTLAVADGARAPVSAAQAWLVRLDGMGRIQWDHRWPGGAGRIDAVAALPDGGLLAAGQVAGAAVLTRLDAAGAIVWEWRRHGAALHALALTADGQVIAAGDRHGRMWVIKAGY